ncbi:MAG: hypothetical protein Q7S74_01010 [Nanoarchaeota archaeon]|nr:hypothetical protein [Nanoarchaeota archaeon]
MEDKKTWAKDAMPLLLMAIWIALSIILFVVMTIISRTVDLGVEGGPLQTISFIWIFISIIVFFILGIFAIIKGIILIRNKKNVKLGVLSLIVGAIIAIPAFFYILSLIFSFGSSSTLEPSYRS